MEGECVVLLGRPIIHTCTALWYKPAFIATWHSVDLRCYM